MSNMFRCTLTGFAACAFFFFAMLTLVTLPVDAGARVTLISFI